MHLNIIIQMVDTKIENIIMKFTKVLTLKIKIFIKLNGNGNRNRNELLYLW
jgi:hypothetical protein